MSNELSVNPTYSWSNSSMSHLISGSYTWSKYDETTILPPLTTSNNTHTALLLYIPTFFNKNISPDFSVMWFKNISTPFSFSLLNASAGIGWKLKKTFNIKGQLQYNIATTSTFTANKNILATSGFDWKLNKKLTWQYTMTANLFRFGSEKPGSSLTPPYSGYPHYMESTLRTGLQYKF